MNKTFFDMFGKLRDKPMSDEELRLVQKLHPTTFKGYPEWLLVEHATNPNLYKKEVGYENIFGEAAKTFSNGNPQDFGPWLQNNLRKMDPFAIKRFFDYLHIMNDAQQQQKYYPTQKQKIHSGGM